MGKYVIHRLLQLIPILLGITLLSFGMMYLAGGDAVTAVLENQGVAVTQDVIDAKRHELGLDQPFLIQYFNWLGGLLTGDMGVSYVSGKDVFATFASKLPATILLTITSVVATVVIAVPLGILAATRQNRFTDYLIRVTSFIGNSLPNFFVALLLIFVFAITLRWLPVISANVGKSGVEAISWTGIILPTATLAIAMASKYTRQIRATVLDELGKPYVAGARARGVPERRILTKNVLNVVRVLADHVLVLKDGEAVEFGEANQVLDNPASSYTRELIAATPTWQREDAGSSDVSEGSEAGNG